MKEESIISMAGVWKSFGEVEVLHGFDLTVPRGQKLVLIGSSGSGKSTVLRILMTLEEINAGSVRIDGEDLWSTDERGRTKEAMGDALRSIRGKVGMVFQHFNLFPHMNVLRNVTEAPVHVLGLSRKVAEERALDLLDRVGLADKAGAYPAQLSGGQKQRVAIARALAMRPKVMLFDEITSALDPELVGEVLNVLRDIALKSDITMLIVTHHINFARDIADRVVFLDSGRILEDDVPVVIFNKPENERTKEFLASVINA
ncbi:MAG: ectoine/hydroxyectoine ABC transporter ATP-binding protein EhuA [Nitrospinota bacterium]